MYPEIAVFQVDGDAQPFPLDRVQQRGVDVQVQHVAILVLLARRFGLEARREVLGVVGAEARLPDRAEQVLEGAVAEEVDALVGEIELHLLRRFLRDPARPEQRLLGARHAGRLVHREVALLDQLLDDLVQQLGELALQVGVPLGVARDSPRHALSMSGVNWPESMSAWRIAWRSASSERSGSSSPNSPQKGWEYAPPAKPDCSRKSASWSSRPWRLIVSINSGRWRL